MGVMIYIFLFMFFLLIVGSVGFIVFVKIKNKYIKFVLRIVILLILGLPVSWIFWLIYGNLMTMIEDVFPVLYNSKRIFFCLYFTVVNILGSFGYILYKYSEKINNEKFIKIKEYIFIFLQINILCDIFPIIILLTE